MHHRGTQHRRQRGDRTLAVEPGSTGGTGHRLGGHLLRAIAGHARVTSEQSQRGKRLATLALPQDARAHRAEPLGGERIKARTHVRVTRDTLAPVDGVPIALGPRLGSDPWTIPFKEFQAIGQVLLSQIVFRGDVSITGALLKLLPFRQDKLTKVLNELFSATTLASRGGKLSLF